MKSNTIWKHENHEVLMRFRMPRPLEMKLRNVTTALQGEFENPDFILNRRQHIRNTNSSPSCSQFFVEFLVLLSCFLISPLPWHLLSCLSSGFPSHPMELFLLCGEAGQVSWEAWVYWRY